jgi:hypothetical protein
VVLPQQRRQKAHQRDRHRKDGPATAQELSRSREKDADNNRDAKENHREFVLEADSREQPKPNQHARTVVSDRHHEHVRAAHPEHRLEAIGGKLVVDNQVNRRGQHA